MSTLGFCNLDEAFNTTSKLNKKKKRFSRKHLKTNDKSIFLTPRRNGNRAKIDPRRLQEVFFSLLNLHLNFGSIFDPFVARNEDPEVH